MLGGRSPPEISHKRDPTAVIERLPDLVNVADGGEDLRGYLLPVLDEISARG